MADIIYTGEFMDDAGNLCRVDIHKVGFDGEAAELVMGSNPVITKTVGTDENKFTHILPTEAYIEVVSSTFLQFVDFFTLPQKTFYIDIYRANAIIWTGWINPEYYTEPFVTYEHTITIHAIDGLAELKNIAFPIPVVIDSNFKQSAFYYILTSLKTIGLNPVNRKIYTSINLVAKKFDHTDITERILESMYFDFRAFQDEDGKMFNCWDVLNEILSAINARLYQNAFQWYIERVDHKYTNYEREIYDINSGVYQSNLTTNQVMELTANLGYGSTIRFEHAANLEIQPAAKKITVTQNYGLRENLFDGVSYKLFQENDFDETTGYLKYWTFYGGTVDHVKDEIFEDCLRIKGIYTGLTYRLRSLVEVQNAGVDNIYSLFYAWKAGRVTLVLSFDVAKRFVQKDNSKTFNASVTLYGNFSGNIYRMKDRDTTSFTILGQKTSNKYGLTVHTTNNGSEGTFEPTSGLDNITIDLVGKDDFVTVNYKVNAPPDEELSNYQTYMQFWIDLLPCVTNLTEEQVDPSDGLLYKNMRLFFQENNTESYSRDIETIIDSNNVLEPENYEVKFGNTPDTTGAGAWGVLHKSVIFDEDGKILRFWGVTGDSLPVLDLTSRIITLTDLQPTYRRPQFMLSGTLLNTTLGYDVNGMILNKVLKDYDDRYYIPLNVSYNMRSLEFESKWLCIRDENFGEFNDDFSEDFFI